MKASQISRHHSPRGGEPGVPRSDLDLAQTTFHKITSVAIPSPLSRGIRGESEGFRGVSGSWSEEGYVFVRGAKKPGLRGLCLTTPAFVSGAGNGIRTRDPNLGKVVLYQLSYTRKQT